MDVNQDEQPNPRFRTQRLINNMLKQRQDMLVLLCKVTGLMPYYPDKPVDALLTEFCQILMDYIAAAHFGLYQRLAEGTERRQPILKTARDIYPSILESTQVTLDFNDRYEQLDDPSYIKTLPDDLSKLGEVLAQRIELEDQLINAMLEGVGVECEEAEA